jgi:hypothetical protein
MNAKSELKPGRRSFLALASHGALLLPLLGISACGRSEQGQVGGGAQSGASDGGLPHLDQNDPSAKSLGYMADGSAVDSTKFPQHVSGQACWKCVLYTGEPKAQWGPCNAFPGKLVNAQGWCSAFSAKA